MALTNEQLQNASTIVQVGRSVGANLRQILAALTAAWTESKLQNLNYGDRDSLGLFQQRPSQGWGTRTQLLDPVYAARAFFLGAGTNKGALQVTQTGTVGQLAQRVQKSAFPGRYDENLPQAQTILQQLSAYSGATASGAVKTATQDVSQYFNGQVQNPSFRKHLIIAVALMLLAVAILGAAMTGKIAGGISGAIPKPGKRAKRGSSGSGESPRKKEGSEEEGSGEAAAGEGEAAEVAEVAVL